jgi:formylglycine-generating enzyme required for sulfatase activity
VQRLPQIRDTTPKGYELRLPTEAEWEYACRAGSTTDYCYGDDPRELSEYAWFSENSRKSTHPVGQKKPNKWGLYDMHGNVWEWCQDWYGEYPKEPVTDPKGPKGGSSRVFRGGGWLDSAGYCRSALRNWDGPSLQYDNVGFRVVLARSSVQGPEKQ